MALSELQILVFSSLSLVLLPHFTGGVAVDTWCMAKPDRNPRALQVALDWACANGADCEPVKQGGLCFEPNNADAHACYAMNSYYQNNLRAPATCDFNGLARVILVNVSYGTCLYPSTPKFPSPPPPPPYGRKTIQGKQRVIEANGCHYAGPCQTPSDCAHACAALGRDPGASRCESGQCCCIQ